MSSHHQRPTIHPWTKSTASQSVYSRTLATPEYMLSMLNDYALGHNCPYLGANISVQYAGLAPSSSSVLSIDDLKSRVMQAFIHTRWIHPMVASQISESKRMVYKVEQSPEVTEWADRTVKTVQQGSGWLALREKLSREVVLPSKDGDCVFLYLIVSPDQASRSQICEFDLLLHVHHGLADGAGLRSTMNEILTFMANPEPGECHVWGEEVDRLTPTALDVADISNEMMKSLAEMPKEVSRSYERLPNIKGNNMFWPELLIFVTQHRFLHHLFLNRHQRAAEKARACWPVLSSGRGFSRTCSRRPKQTV
jgi:15-O-acetyltransferase Tri3